MDNTPVPEPQSQVEPEYSMANIDAAVMAAARQQQPVDPGLGAGSAVEPAFDLPFVPTPAPAFDLPHEVPAGNAPMMSQPQVEEFSPPASSVDMPEDTAPAVDYVAKAGASHADDNMQMNFITEHVHVRKSDPSFLQGVITKINDFKYPEDVAAKELKDRVGYWIAAGRGTGDEKAVARDFREFIINGSHLSKNQEIGVGEMNQAAASFQNNPQQPGNPNASAARMASNLGSDLAGAAVGAAMAPIHGLSSLVDGWMQKRSDRKIEARINAATESGYKMMNDMDAIVHSDLDVLRKNVTKLGETPAGPERDALTDMIANQSGDIGKKIKTISEAQSRLSSDPSVETRFRRSEREIKDEAEDATNKVDKVLQDAQKAVEGDHKNSDKLKEASSKLQDMLERITQMIKNIFDGFKKSGDPAHTAGPKP